MKIGIIVYSQTGNTLTVAQMLKQKLLSQGHQAEVERVTVSEGTGRGAQKSLSFVPDVSPYDWLIFGSPVQGFELAVPMAAYLQQIGSLEGKKIACFVTKRLPQKWTGGNRAIAKIKQICTLKKGKVLGSAIVFWTAKRKDSSIAACIDELSSLLN